MPITKRMRKEAPAPEQPVPAVADRQELREQLSKRFEHTLRRLAR